MLDGGGGGGQKGRREAEKRNSMGNGISVGDGTRERPASHLAACQLTIDQIAVDAVAAPDHSPVALERLVSKSEARLEIGNSFLVEVDYRLRRIVGRVSAYHRYVLR